MSLAPRIDALDLPNVRASEGSGTTTLVYNTVGTGDNMWQIFNLSASRTVVLPSTGVVAGQRVRLDNIAAFDLVVQASGGSALTVANSTNLDATIRNGHVQLVALQATPTLPSHWRVLEVDDTGSYTDTTTGAITQTATVTWYRYNKMVTMSCGTPAASASASNSITIPGTNMPVRIRPASLTKYGATEVESAASTVTGQFSVGPTGSMTFNKYDASNFTSTTSLGDGTSPNTFSYIL